jgi:flagellar capping protein FliD
MSVTHSRLTDAFNKAVSDTRVLANENERLNRKRNAVNAWDSTKDDKIKDMENELGTLEGQFGPMEERIRALEQTNMALKAQLKGEILPDSD